MRGRLTVTLLYPLALVVGHIPVVDAHIRWCGSGAPTRHAPEVPPCHAMPGCERKRVS